MKRAKKRAKRHTGTFSEAERELFETHIAFNPPLQKPPPVQNRGRVGTRSLTALARAGKVPVDMRLDLHGKTVEEAWRSVEAALERAQPQGWRVFCVITGKGYRSPGGVGVLAAEIPERLRCDERVAEVVQAVKAKDGGEGAWFVRLR